MTGSPWIAIAAGCGLAVAAGLMVACRSTTPASKVEFDSLVFDEITSGQNSAIRDKRIVVCRTNSEFQTLWAKHTSLQMPTPPAPEIDFESSMVIGVFLGNCPSSGYGVRTHAIDVYESGSSSGDAPEGIPAGPAIVVSVETEEPQEGVMTAQMITAPFQLLAVDQADGVPRWALGLVEDGTFRALSEPDAPSED